MKLQTLLERLLEEDMGPCFARAPKASERSSDLDEAAIPIGQAKKEQLALMTTVDALMGAGRGGGVMLYNPLFALNGIEETMERNGEEASLEDTLEQAFEDSRAIVGYLAYEPYQSGESFYYVNLSAADTGYGPLLYDLALASIHPGSLTSDRHSVSKAAQRIWRYYFDNRVDVNKRLIAGADDIRQYGKLVPTMSAGGGQLRYIVQEYQEADQRLKDIEREEQLQLRAKHGASLVDRSKEKKEASLQLKTAVKEYKEDIMDNPLAYQYSIKRRLNTDALVSTHLRFVEYLQREYKISWNDVEDILNQSGEKFARGRIP